MLFWYPAEIYVEKKIISDPAKIYSEGPDTPAEISYEGSDIPQKCIQRV
jgi:hypothetical protein